MESKEANKKEFPSFDDLFGNVSVDEGVEEMQLSDLGYKIDGED